VSDLPTSADVVVIGAGIVGNSMVRHLAELGWRDILQIDKGPLPNPGGSTGHASNFIFPVDHGKELALLTLESVRQYREMGVFTESGGIEVARSEERLEELRRRMSSATAWGIEAHLLTPAEVADLVPFIETDAILGGFYTPSVGVVDSLRAGTLMRERAEELGALTAVPNTEVTGIDVEDGHLRRVRTDRGDVETEVVVVACGVWSPRIAAMAGATIPLTPAVHQMIDVGPLPPFQATTGEIAYPIVRDMDTNMYERQNGNDMEIGSYAHRPILHRPDEIPSIEQSRLSPTELPFTEEDFDPQMEDALELFPEILTAEGAGIRHAINGLLSLTPDGAPLLGPTEVAGLWSAAAVWIKEGPGVGRALAEWMTHGTAYLDLHGADVSRFYPYQRTEHHIRARTSEGFNKTYGIVHPREQWESNRPVRTAPMYLRETALDAVFFEAGGWERPQWYGSNQDLVDRYGVEDRPHEWDRRWWSPIINAEHLHLREHAGMIDLTAFALFDVSGPGATDYLQRMVVTNVDRTPGRIMYTPVLAPNGGFRSDLTVIRTGDTSYRIVTGGADGPRDWAWFASHVPADGSVVLADVTTAYTTIGVWGPKARDIVSQLTDADLSNAAFPYGGVREVVLAGVPTVMARISYVGDLGWEITTSMDHALHLWDALSEAGEPHELRPVGGGVYGTTGRLEKGYRLMGAELEWEYSPVEADLAFPKVKQADFIGKEAYVAARDQDPAAIMCTLIVDDHTSSRTGQARYMTGNEPIVTPDGARIVDRHGRPSYVTSAGSGPSLGSYLLMAYLPPEHAEEGTQLAVNYMDELFPVTVARVGRRPLFDPEDERMRA
jgi:glycine cleavage system aminomethyltransferase T/glycine/D-amino acid oxidase-like deaminating enzyme